jgi:long-chain acyl-CoA synthetase
VNFCATRLATYKIPIEFVELKEFPKNAGGKVLKHVLRDGLRR